jgi:hypothetical protein
LHNDDLKSTYFCVNELDSHVFGIGACLKTSGEMTFDRHGKRSIRDRGEWCALKQSPVIFGIQEDLLLLVHPHAVPIAATLNVAAAGHVSISFWLYRRGVLIEEGEEVKQLQAFPAPRWRGNEAAGAWWRKVNLYIGLCDEAGFPAVAF